VLNAAHSEYTREMERRVETFERGFVAREWRGRLLQVNSIGTFRHPRARKLISGVLSTTRRFVGGNRSHVHCQGAPWRNCRPPSAHCKQLLLPKR
jgi:hypothetical protein